MQEALPPVLLLDMDDTILDDSGARDECWRLACAEAAAVCEGLDADGLHREIELVRVDFWSDADRHREWRQRMREAQRHVACQALRNLGVGDDELGSRVGDRHFELRFAAMQPLAGAIDALHALRAAGVKLGLVTNGASEGQRPKIERFALAAHFDYIGIEGEVGCGKPEPEAFRAALRALGAQPADAWMVGDNLVWDVAGAQAAGLRGIWLDRHAQGLPADSDVVPDRTILALAELLPAALASQRT